MAKCIVITGAGSGLGRAVARRLAADGHTLVLLGRTASSLEAVAVELGAACHTVQCDVADPESVRTAFVAIGERHGTIDVLINNAAVYQVFTVEEATDAQIATAMTINFAGPIYCSRAVIPLMQKGSQIINISSEAVGKPFAMFSLYQSSKAGLERFSEALHDELEPAGIRVTMIRCGQMMDADSKSPTSGEVARRFAEENLKRGLNLRDRPTSSFISVTNIFQMLVDLPDDINVPRLIVEARRP